MYQQSLPQLPFSPDQLQRAYIPGIGPNNPAFVPPPGTIQGHPSVLQYVPAISGWAAAEIQAQAESNALRKFMFNMFGAQNFANEDFVALVQGIVDYLEVQMSANPGLTVQAILDKTILQTVEMVCANLTVPWPSLMHYMNPQAQGVVNQQVQFFQNLKAATQRLRGGYGMAQQGMGNYPGTQQMPQSRVDPRLGGNAVPLVGGGGSSLFTNTPANIPLNPQGNSMASTSRWSNRQLVDNSMQSMNITTITGGQGTGGVIKVAPSSIPQNQEVQQFQQEAQVSTPITQEGPLEPIYASKLKWTRSDDMPYFPAFNPDMHCAFLQRIASGSVIIRFRAPEDPLAMEYDRHKLVSTFGAPFKPIDRERASERVERIRAGLKNIRLEQEVRKTPPEGESPITFPTHVNPVFAVDMMEELIWLKTSCNWLESTQNGKKADIYRRYGYVVEMVVGTESEDHYIETLRATRTWEGIWKTLNDLRGTMSVPLWHRVNDRLTALVNRVIEFNLSLSDGTIDSFAADLPDLIAYLRDKYGEVILRAFKRNEGYLINSIFEQVEHEQSIADLEDFFLPDEDPEAEIDPEKKIPVFTHLIKAASFTFLNCLSHELKIEFDHAKTALLTESLTPVLYAIAAGIVRETNAVEETTFANHYIQTLDGRILEIDTGFLGEETYVIRLVK